MNRETIEILNSAECTGCGACMNACPVDAIKMKPNSEGFLFPCIDHDKCIHCGKCVGSCPALEYTLHPESQRECYAVMANDKIRMKSSSGGVFTLLAQYILKKVALFVGLPGTRIGLYRIKSSLQKSNWMICGVLNMLPVTLGAVIHKLKNCWIMEN